MLWRLPKTSAPLVSALLGFVVSTSAAQSPEQRLELEQFRDSISYAADSTELLAIEQELIDYARVNRDDALAHLKLGFVSLALGDMGAQTHYDDAASEFQWASELKPSWPYSWYGLGLAEQGVGDSQISIIKGLKTMLGKDALTRSAMAFAKSAEVDPSFDAGLVHLARTALRQRINIKLDLALEALRAADTMPAGRQPMVLLYRGRVEREIGDLQLAEAAFKEFLESGHNTGLGQLELARTEFLLGELASAADRYFAGARTEDSVTVALYRYDLGLIATEDELRAFDATTRNTRSQFIREFWTEKDRVELRRKGERLREHFRRLFYSRQNFALVSTNRVYDISEIYRSGREDFDDRGVIYIRHGEPTDRASLPGVGIANNESWRYGHPDGDLIFHFVARDDVQDYRLVESVFDILGYSQAIALRGTGANASPQAVELLDSRDRLSPLYRRIKSAGSGSTNRLQAEERVMGRTSIELGTTSDSYELEFPESLDVIAQVLGVGYRGDRGLIHVAFAIPGSSLLGIDNPRGTIYPVRLRFVALDSAGHSVGFADTTRVFLSRSPVPDDEFLVGEVSLPAVPGHHAYLLAIQQGDRNGVVLPTDSVLVARVDGEVLGLSDPVLGSRRSNLVWQPQPGDSVFFNPHQLYRRDDLAELYYEIYGLTPGATYETQLVVRKGDGGGGGLLGKIFGGGSTPISLRFEEVASDKVMRIQRAIEFRKLKPGDYTLRLIVTDDQGNVRQRDQAFEIIE